jgi:hypothetical protein
MINNQIKPLYIFFQCIAILASIINLLRAYLFSSDKKISESLSYFLMVYFDMIIIPFYSVLGIKYGANCIQNSISL